MTDTNMEPFDNFSRACEDLTDSTVYFHGTFDDLWNKMTFWQKAQYKLWDAWFMTKHYFRVILTKVVSLD